MSDQKSNLEPIAIVGIYVELPSGTTEEHNLDHKSFFEFLLKKKQSYEKFPPSRFKNDICKGPTLGQVVTDIGSFLKDFADFDPVEFGIPSKDARAMAVSTRKLIEASFLALLDSGISYRGRNVGCYMSAVSFDGTTIAHADEYEPRGSFAGYPYMVANKVSYYLDLLGPSIPVDTACSSTMTAIHLGVQALRSGECESAVIGGCQLNHRLLDFIQYSQGGVLAPDGKCKPFDASANGFSRGEGVGAVVLKPLADALRDGDYIYASILGTAINSSGAAAPVSAPVAGAQMDAMQRAFSGTGRLPSEVDYIELHATGTAAGDPVEANWVGSTFGRRVDELLIGSVKGNIGHLEIMSFLASLSKVCSIIQSGIIPPTVNLETPNPAIRWLDYKMRAPVDSVPLKPCHHSGRALISMTSSGIGGSNGHIVLEGPPSRTSSVYLANPVESPFLMVAGGLSPNSTEATRDALIALMSENTPDLPAISTTYGRRARQMTWRSVAVCSATEKRTSFSPPHLAPRAKHPVVFVFSGQGPQHFQMGRQLFKQYSVFKESIERMDRVHKAFTGVSLMAETGLFADVSSAQPLPEIWPVHITLPALCMLQMALFDLLASLGIFPDIVLGHSAGETAMAYASGATSQAMALQLSIARGAALSACDGTGSMAAITCPFETANLLVHEALHEFPNGVLEISCYNTPEAVALSGTNNLIERVVALAEKHGIFARTLRTHLPAHSSLLDSCQPEYKNRLKEIFDAHPEEHRPKIHTYSTFTGALWDEPFSADYFWSNTRNPVLFSNAVTTLLQDAPDATFIEVGPHPVLGSYISTLGSSSTTVIAPMRRNKTPQDFYEAHTLLVAIGELITSGYNLVDFHSLNGTSPTKKISGPPYPFSKKQLPYYPESYDYLINRTRHPNGTLNDLNLGLNSLTHPMLAQHVIRDEPIMPATGYLEMAFEFGARYLWNTKFLNIMPLFPDRILRVQVAAEGHLWTVRSWPSITEGTDARAPRIHAQGYMAKTHVSNNYTTVDLNAIRNRSQPVDMKGFYQRMLYFAQYGGVYQRVTGCYVTDSEGLIRVRSSEDDLVDAGKYHLHPVVLDSCLHALVHPVFTRNQDNTVYYLPASVEAVTLHESFMNRRLPPTVYGYARMCNWAPDSMTWDVAITNESGARICTLTGLRMGLHETGLYTPAPSRFGLIYQAMGNQQRKELVHLDQSPDDTLEICLEKFRNALNAIAAVDRKQVARIFLVCAGMKLLPTPAVKSLHLRYTFGSDMSDMLDFASAHNSRVRFDPHRGTGAPEPAFDIIVVFGIMPHFGKPSLIETSSDLLQYGGYLIMGNTLSDVSSGVIWSETALRACFSRVELHKDSARAAIFWLEAQKSSLPIFPRVVPNEKTADIAPPNLAVIHFDANQILQHQPSIQALENVPQSALWISATGVPHNAAVLGFSRSLRREMHSTRVYLVVFDPIWAPEARLRVIQELSNIPGIEREVFVNHEGHITVPRIIHRPFTPDKRRLDLERPWTVKENNLLQRPPPPVQNGYVLVRITHLSFPSAGLRGFFGLVVKSASTIWSHDTPVVGVVENQISNYVLVHEGEITVARENGQLYATLAIPLVVIAMTVGIEAIRAPLRLTGRQFLITNGDTTMGRCLTKLLVNMGITPTTTSEKPCDMSADSAIRQSQFILSGCSDKYDVELVQSKMRPDAVATWWNISMSQQLESNRWFVGDTLREVERLALTALDIDIVAPTPGEHLAAFVDTNDVQTSIFLFDAEKTYLLIGGIGSLGLHIAWWMYQNGAREIILTSRSGEASLARAKNVPAIRLLTYLRGIPGLNIRLVECDAASPVATSELIGTFPFPLAGCILLSASFSDGVFATHTESTFFTPFPPKEGAFRALEKSVTIQTLDFVVALSSVTGLFGSPGQSNYSAANTALEGLLRPYPNALSIVAPAILDTAHLTSQKDLAHDARYKTWTAWGMTARQLCDYLKDGILSLYGGTSDQIYIPQFDWEELQVRLGASPMFHHLLRTQKSEATPSVETSSTASSIRQMIIRTLDVEESDFFPEIPLTSYGLDSLSAGRLSFLLKPHLAVTQLQLLADMTFDDLCGRIQSTPVASIEPGAARPHFDWHSLHQPGQTVVRLVDGEGIPLIVVHGASGNVVAFMPLQERFNSALWAIQTTPETPMDSIEAMAEFYFQQIKLSQPVGPYRLAGYSGCSLLAFHLARWFEDHGDHIVQFVMLDHFPMLYVSPMFCIDEETTAKREASKMLTEQALLPLLDLYRDHGRPGIADELMDAFKGLEVRDFIKDYYRVLVKIVTMTARFLLDGLGDDVESHEREEALKTWLRELKAPITHVVALRGMRRGLPGTEWEDLGCRACFEGAKILFIDAGHFDMFENDEVVDQLQYGW
ncbi:hypothetical protein DFH08DRAFT_787573 [Mycena albidolilacea]|uniref:Polyketide synthase n=1 Tax=Mycena albidolilacea TaxID=1033008 RepID=A0AAD6ZJ64_9AGAR|nr:hypothetical protein DFH08DRAFT_787573 [Mycena albidolilacea]